MSEYFTLDDIAQYRDLAEVDIEVPQFGGKRFRARAMDKNAAMRMQREIAQCVTDGDDVDSEEVTQKKLVKYTIVKPELDDNAVDQLFTLPASAINVIVRAVLRINGMGEEVNAATQRGFLQGDAGGHERPGDDSGHEAIPGDGNTTQDATGSA